MKPMVAENFTAWFTTEKVGNDEVTAVEVAPAPTDWGNTTEVLVVKFGSPL
jgi:hypothetical protein